MMRPNNWPLFTLALLALPALARSGQFGAPGSPTVGSYIASGPTAESDIARLRAALLKIPGVKQVELTMRSGGVTLHIHGPQTGTLFATAARSVGFDLRQMPVRSYLGSSSSADPDPVRLREALAKVAGVEQVEIGKSNGATLVRVRGLATAQALAASAKTVGFEMIPASSYVATGPTGDAELKQLRTALEQVAGVKQVETRGLPGGASVVIRGDASDDALAAAGKAVGFGMLPVSDAGGSLRFTVTGVTNQRDEERLRKALQAAADSGEFHFLKTPAGVQLDVIGTTAPPETLVTAARAIDVNLHPIDTITSLSVAANGERITPPAPGERTLEELAKLGELAPDFTLIEQDGKSTVQLSDYRGKKPVVLIFGSYT